MSRAYYSDSIADFVRSDPDATIGKLAQASEFPVETTQRDAWLGQIQILMPILGKYEGSIYFEYSIPRMGERIDVVLLIDAVIFVLEFKVGEKDFTAHAVDQVCDYALDLKNFHESSHDCYVAPILIATKAKACEAVVAVTPQNDKLLFPIKSVPDTLISTIDAVLEFTAGDRIEAKAWETGRYCPTPTIIEAAMALYRKHDVAEISRSDAGAKNLHQTTDAISKVIRLAKERSHKAICFVTGVPGAGKTLIGLNIATKHLDADGDMYSVFLSGNDPLVRILQEALARDKIRREKAAKKRISKKEALSEVKAFVQNVRHYRDEYLKDSKPPVDHVALFDEAQRAWNLAQTANFMRRKRNRPNFSQSEPEFLISCIDRHSDWGVIVCLVGGGQEINTGEAGIGEWIEALNRSFPQWHIHISDRLTDSEYGAGAFLEKIKTRPNVSYSEDLHLSVSMRSFRAENVSLLVKQMLDLDAEGARQTFRQLNKKYPIVITRNVKKAKEWLKENARGSERYGIVVSSSAERLRPHAIHVKAPMDPVHWFLAGKEDVRSSYYLEDVATEFSIQGLELDWACVTWDADFRYEPQGWRHFSFCGDKWNRVKKHERQDYLKNAYRVLLTRARQGMVIVVPQGDVADPTRLPEFYDPSFEYLRGIGFPVI
ncbi:MAG TPA: DUF2075 domain-containing protein [Kiritimatiellia bacterium]|nr:DUF2075 domain-containing protein [Kiritimatiellia bacterium]